MPRRDTLASKHKCLTPINKPGTCRIATKVGTRLLHRCRAVAALPEAGTRTGKTAFAAPGAVQPHDERAVKGGLFYVRRHTCADGSFEWYVLNGHTRRPASKLFRTRAAAAAERARLQVKLELAKEQVLKRTP